MIKQNQAQFKVKGLEDLRAKHIASLGLAHESGKKLHKGLSELSQFQSEHVANIFEDTMNTMKAMMSAKTLQDAAKIQKDWVQNSMKLSLQHGSHLSKKTAALMKDVSQPVQEHIKKTVGEAAAKAKEFTNTMKQSQDKVIKQAEGAVKKTTEQAKKFVKTAQKTVKKAAKKATKK